MRRVRAYEVNTPDEVANELNKIIDNMELVEAKVVQLAQPKPKPKDKKKDKKKGDKNA